MAKSKQLTDEDIDLLEELGVDTETEVVGAASPRHQRIIAGFEEILGFVAEYGRAPQHGDNRDIFERLYAVRLDSLRRSAECREILKSLDKGGLLDGAIGAEEQLNDDELLAALGVSGSPGASLTKLVHVRSQEEIKAAEEIAQRSPCKDFEKVKPLFVAVQKDLESGARATIKYRDDAEVAKGDLFILDGQKVLIAELGDWFTPEQGRKNRRLRVIYDNGTESDLLVRSLQRALNKDRASRRIISGTQYHLFSDKEEEGDTKTGHIYVLRSKSAHPFIAEHRSVIHKIGVTGGDIEKRIANAEKDPTYLFADVEVVASFKLANIDRRALESLIHRFFADARLDLELKDRFGFEVAPREWFIVSVPVIEEAIEKLKEGLLDEYQYHPPTGRIIRRA
jgi:hypothetical protein